MKSGGIASNTTKSAKDLAKQIAKQMAGELPEILKTAGSQVTGAEKPQSREGAPAPQNSSDQAKLIEHQQQLQDQMKAGRRMEALDRELEDIRKQEVFKDLQRKISEGEKPSLEDYPELSMEQKQVLNAQVEAVEFQIKQQEYAESKSGGGLFGSAKKGRKMGASKGQKGGGGKATNKGGKTGTSVRVIKKGSPGEH